MEVLLVVAVAAVVGASAWLGYRSGRSKIATIDQTAAILRDRSARVTGLLRSIEEWSSETGDSLQRTRERLERRHRESLEALVRGDRIVNAAQEALDEIRQQAAMPDDTQSETPMVTLDTPLPEAAGEIYTVGLPMSIGEVVPLGVEGTASLKRAAAVMRRALVARYSFDSIKFESEDPYELLLPLQRIDLPISLVKFVHRWVVGSKPTRATEKTRFEGSWYEEEESDSDLAQLLKLA